MARDGGCTFPGCTMPAPWTEAHHIKYATDDGETSTDNGCLLCSFHHHLVHKEKWAITVRNGVPWFIPPAYVDPDRRPIRNHYFNRKPHHRKYHQTEIEYANTG
ncbi:HNH endonuclease [Arthrobacter pigmenti]